MSRVSPEVGDLMSPTLETLAPTATNTQVLMIPFIKPGSVYTRRVVTK